MELLSGNEAVALGAYHSGAQVGTGYPGTPSTETLEAFAVHEDVYAEWCTNEKVALEVALGASAAGKRCLVTMKHGGSTWQPTRSSRPPTQEWEEDSSS